LYFENALLPGTFGNPSVEVLMLTASDGFGGQVSNEISLSIYP